MKEKWTVKARLGDSPEPTWVWGGTVIEGSGTTPPRDAVVMSNQGDCLSMTLCDTHTHGALGLDVSADTTKLRQLIELLHSRGVGSFQLSTITQHASRIHDILQTVRALSVDEASLIGVHLEGPFLGPEKRGAHDPALLKEGSLDTVKSLVEPFLDIVSSLTVDPRVVDPAAIDWLVRNGVTVAIGHTAATYSEALEAFEAGATVLTHAFNAMLPISSREPGPVVAALDASAWIEVIADGHHVHPSLVRILFTLAPHRIVLVSDSMSSAGLEDGDYWVGSVPVRLEAGIARTTGGALAGSTLALPDAVSNVFGWGVPLREAIDAATLNPRSAYDAPVPVISPGHPANFLLWSDSGHLSYIVREGRFSESTR